VTFGRLTLAVLLAGVLTLGSFGAARAGDPDALWKIVHDRCSPAAAMGRGAAPCEVVATPKGLRTGYAVLKDRDGATQFLLIPTAKITGIESPDILAPGAANYFQAAWDARRYVMQRAGVNLPRQDIGLAINSARGRSQNQLHIHIDCVEPEVRRILKAEEPRIGRRFSDERVNFHGHGYRVMKIASESLAGVNPFAVVAGALPEARKAMGDQTIALVGARFRDGRDGFYLLEDQANFLFGDHASGAEILDHACAVKSAP
jgi:CDP-diacylglycerol pyrophosphatase